MHGTETEFIFQAIVVQVVQFKLVGNELQEAPGFKVHFVVSYHLNPFRTLFLKIIKAIYMDILDLFL